MIQNLDESPFLLTFHFIFFLIEMVQNKFPLILYNKFSKIPTRKFTSCRTKPSTTKQTIVHHCTSIDSQFFTLVLIYERLELIFPLKK